MKKIKKIIFTLLYSLFRVLPIRKNTVLFFSYYGEQYSGSPKYISNYLQNTGFFNIVWAFTNRSNHKQYDGKTVHYSGIAFYYYLATSHVIITNYRMTPEFVKRPAQKYIQTWHSSLRLKMIENDAIDTLPEKYIKMAKNDSTQIDILLAGSKKSQDIFEQSFWYDGLIACTGTPQCDILFDSPEPYQKKVKEYFHIPSEMHIAMYAPTFRKNSNTDVYDINCEKLCQVLENKFGGSWCILMRLHPHLVKNIDCFTYSEKVIQATMYDDVQELLCATEFLITDYSAIMFDFALTKRPCVLYTPDIDSYTANDRKLYFDIQELPFRHYQNQNHMFSEIMNFSTDDYNSRISQFLDQIGSFDDGSASERVYKLISRETV